MIMYCILMKILVIRYFLVMKYLGVLSIDLNKFNPDDTNYDEDDPETVIHIRILAWHINFEKRKALEKELNKELMLIA